MLGPDFDAGRLGEVVEDFRWLALGKLGAVEIDAHLDAAIGGARERLHDRPIRQDVCGQVDFMLGAIDQRDVDVFEILRRRVVNDRRRVGRGPAPAEASRNAAVREVRKQVRRCRRTSLVDAL